MLCSRWLTQPAEVAGDFRRDPCRGGPMSDVTYRRAQIGKREAHTLQFEVKNSGTIQLALAPRSIVESVSPTSPRGKQVSRRRQKGAPRAAVSPSTDRCRGHILHGMLNDFKLSATLRGHEEDVRIPSLIWLSFVFRARLLSLTTFPLALCFTRCFR